MSIAASSMSMTSISTSAVAYDVTALIAAGTDYSNRVGRRIRVFRAFFKGQLAGGQNNSVADDPYDTVRITLVVAKPGFTPTWGVNAPIDPRYNPASGLIRVLRDETRVINALGKDSVGYVPGATCFEFDVGVNLPIEYSASAASTPSNRCIYLVAVSDSVAVTHPGFTSTSSFGVQFIDD
jgi:hypothetical protein